MRIVKRGFLIAALLSALPALAANGINLIGFGAESSLTGGADTAAARDTSSLNTNPAGLVHIERAAADYYGCLYVTDLVHSDGLGNERRASNRLTFLGGGGYARGLRDSRLTLGVGVFVQGGAGAVYKDLRTPFGARDTFSALTGIVKVAPGFAYQATDKLALGAALSIVHASTKQRLFPGTSVFDPVDPSRSFFGAEIRDAKALRARARLGLQYRALPRLTLGLAYANRLALPLRGGRLDSNQSALGLGSVAYTDARRLQLLPPPSAGLDAKPALPADRAKAPDVRVLPTAAGRIRALRWGRSPVARAHPLHQPAVAVRAGHAGPARLRRPPRHAEPPLVKAPGKRVSSNEPGGPYTVRDRSQIAPHAKTKPRDQDTPRIPMSTHTEQWAGYEKVLGSVEIQVG